GCATGGGDRSRPACRAGPAQSGDGRGVECGQRGRRETRQAPRVPESGAGQETGGCAEDRVLEGLYRLALVLRYSGFVTERGAGIAIGRSAVSRRWLPLL